MKKHSHSFWKRVRFPVLWAIAGLFLETIRELLPVGLHGVISAESIALAVYAACVVLFVAGSLLFPDRDTQPVEASS